MNKNLLVLLALVILTSCSGSHKLKSIVEFTARLKSDSNKSVIVGEEKEVGDFGNQINFVRNSTYSYKINPIKFNNFKKTKVASNSMIFFPSVIGSKVYAIDSIGTIFRIDIKTGKEDWKSSLNTQKRTLSAATLSYSADKLFITADLQLIVINAESGKEIVRKSLDDLVKNQPLIISNAFFVQNVSNNLLAYNIDTWSPVWTYDSWPETLLTGNITSSVAVGGQLITGFSSGQLISNNIATGEELWQMNLLAQSSEHLGSFPSSISTQPIAVGSDIYVASNNGYLLKVDTTRAHTVWQKQVDDVISMSISGNTIFLTTNARQLVAVSTEDGSIIWTTDLMDPKQDKKDKIKATHFLPPIVTNEGVIIFAKDAGGYVVDPINGNLKKFFAIPKNISSFAINGPNLIVFDSNNFYTMN